MDSITQILLGASVGISTLAKKEGLKKTIFFGAVFGTLPDLDMIGSIWQDEVTSFTSHRGWSHSFFVNILLSIPFAFFLKKFFFKKSSFTSVYVFVSMILLTHILIDLFTVYGTRIFLPFSDFPYAIGSVFIIDPIFSIILLVGIIFALNKDKFGINKIKKNSFCLYLSSFYLIFSIFLQQIANHKAKSFLKKEAIPYKKLMSQPTAFNIFAWRNIAVNDYYYYEFFWSIFKPSSFQLAKKYDRNLKFESSFKGDEDLAKLKGFSKSFFSYSKINLSKTIKSTNNINSNGSAHSINKENDVTKTYVIFTDLRFGMANSYFFNFLFAKKDQNKNNYLKIDPARTLKNQNVNYKKLMSKLSSIIW